jgi:competence protein ComEA
MISKIKDLFIGVLFGLLSAGLILLVSKPKPGRAILLRPAPTPHPVVINIDGAVVSPGVYTLPVQSRVVDAVEAAGGLAENASPGSVNLAAELEDGSQIYIPARNLSQETSAELVGIAVGISESGEMISLVNINQASLEALIGLPGIGPVTAEKIINYREDQIFTRIEEIQKVPGIGPATFEQIKIYLTVGE